MINEYYTTSDGQQIAKEDLAAHYASLPPVEYIPHINVDVDNFRWYAPKHLNTRHVAIDADFAKEVVELSKSISLSIPQLINNCLSARVTMRQIEYYCSIRKSQPKKHNSSITIFENDYKKLTKRFDSDIYLPLKYVLQLYFDIYTKRLNVV